ncbi:ABC transporter permease [Salinarimonas sp.]|uniref:ABC transporter permease n=1 Tax=Salinarimonas sp. TaxID=2766526 RepID=UPI0032D8C68F
MREHDEETMGPSGVARAAGGAAAAVALLVFWEGAVRLFALPAYMLPAPSRIGATLLARWQLILENALVTAAETLIGLAVGAAVGVCAALLIGGSRRARTTIGPLLPMAQAIPVFAIAPLLVTWLGFGLAPKIAMAALIIFFPVASAFYDGLRRVDENLVELARLYGAGPLRLLFMIRAPAALPSLGAGLRVAAGVAPIGAVVGEWVGSAAGLGHLMLHANARAQTDLVFACLIVLALFALALWRATDWAVSRALHWAPETLRG